MFNNKREEEWAAGCLEKIEIHLLRQFNGNSLLLSRQLQQLALAQTAQAQHVLLLRIRQLQPIQPLLTAAQTAFAIALAIGLTNTDAGAGNAEKFELFHWRGNRQAWKTALYSGLKSECHRFATPYRASGALAERLKR